MSILLEMVLTEEIWNSSLFFRYATRYVTRPTRF